MTVCLTFDDGLKDHHDIAAPALESFGWRGVFNVPTSLMDEGYRRINQDWVADMCLKGHEDNLMSWNDARDLHNRGHEVFPHSCNHINLLRLEEAGETDEVERQIIQSKHEFEKNMGFSPRFFCSPHNKKSRFIIKTARKNGMELVECWRENFGAKIPHVYQGSITDFLKERSNAGWEHVDIMIHGIVRANGGWAPFENQRAFTNFLCEIHRLEIAGLIKVVSYSSCHRGVGVMTPLLNFAGRARSKLYRTVRKWCRYQ